MSTTTWSSRYPEAACGSWRAARRPLADLASGLAYFRPAGVEHDVFNDLDRELVFVEVELIG